MNRQEQERRDQELSEALEQMHKSLREANGNCSAKIRGRTTKIRRAIREIAKGEPVD